jgi:hypothetical protein
MSGWALASGIVVLLVTTVALVATRQVLAGARTTATELAQATRQPLDPPRPSEQASSVLLRTEHLRDGPPTAERPPEPSR